MHGSRKPGGCHAVSNKSDEVVMSNVLHPAPSTETIDNKVVESPSAMCVCVCVNMQAGCATGRENRGRGSV